MNENKDQMHIGRKQLTYKETDKQKEQPFRKKHRQTDVERV